MSIDIAKTNVMGISKLSMNQIYTQPDCILWVLTPPGEKLIDFVHAEDRYYPLGKYLLHIPSCLWQINVQSYGNSMDSTTRRVVAVKESSQDIALTPIYTLPLPNVERSGRICLGNAYYANTYKKDVATIVNHSINLFWESSFVDDELSGMGYVWPKASGSRQKWASDILQAWENDHNVFKWSLTGYDDTAKDFMNATGSCFNPINLPLDSPQFNTETWDIKTIGGYR